MSRGSKIVGLLFFVSSQFVAAQVSLHAIFSDHMVLQQGQKNPVWGKAIPGAVVRVEINGKTYKTKAKKDSTWIIRLDRIPSVGPYEMTISSGELTLRFSDIMIGEVWVCSGQSNMHMPVGGWPNGKGGRRNLVTNSAEEIANANYPQIRLFQAKYASGKHNGDNIVQEQRGWELCTPEAISNFSGTAYFFGRELFQQLKVPIGLLHSSVGGSQIESWIPKSYWKNTREFKRIRKDSTSETYQKLIARKGNLYDEMLVQNIPYGVKGALWYQGEFNTGNGYAYRHLLPVLISSWREKWKQKQMPFIFIQLPIIGKKQDSGLEESSWADLRESQQYSLSVPNTGMAVTIDLPDGDLHPHNKQDFGKRAADVALARFYHLPIPYIGPLYKSCTIEGNRIRLFFSNPEVGLQLCEEGKGFAIAGEDRRFYTAHATIEGETIVISSPSVPHPRSVRYAWGNNPPTSLCSSAGLPASPFRTDNWPLITQKKN